MYNQRTSTRGIHRKSSYNAKFGHSKKSGGGFQGKPPRFSARRGKPKTAKLDISAFINKAAASSVKEKVFVPEHSFADFNLSAALLRAIEQKGYTNPTAIQDGIIPSIVEGKDVVGLSNTGTGKTAAFLIPLIEKVLQNPQ